MNGKEIVHFMHIGKTGGSVIKNTLKKMLVHEKHGFRLNLKLLKNILEKKNNELESLIEFNRLNS